MSFVHGFFLFVCCLFFCTWIFCLFVCCSFFSVIFLFHSCITQEYIFCNVDMPYFSYIRLTEKWLPFLFSFCHKNSCSPYVQLELSESMQLQGATRMQLHASKTTCNSRGKTCPQLWRDLCGDEIETRIIWGILLFNFILFYSFCTFFFPSTWKSTSNGIFNFLLFFMQFAPSMRCFFLSFYCSFQTFSCYLFYFSFFIK